MTGYAGPWPRKGLSVRRFKELPRDGVRRLLVVPFALPVVNHEFASIDTKEV